MYTSCGWFFDDLAGIEATQVLFYAARALQLARETLGRDLSGPFLERLGRAKSNVPERGDGRRIWAETVEPAVIDLEKFGAHVAISLMFEGDEAAAHGCRVELEQERRLGSGPARMAVGSMRVTAEVTEESARLGFAVLHFGDHNVSCGIRRHAGDEAHARMVSDLSGAMRAADLTAAVRLLDRHFPATYALNSLFRDKQRRAIDILVRERLEDATATARQVWEANAGLMRFLAELGIPQPEPLCSAARQVIQADLRDELDHDGADTGHVRALLDEARRLGIDLDTAGLGLGFQRLLEARMARLLEEPHDPERLDAAVELAELIRDLRFEVDLWRVQNGLYGLLEHHHAGTLRRAAESGRTGEAARAWLARVERLAAALHIRIDGPRRA